MNWYQKYASSNICFFVDLDETLIISVSKVSYLPTAPPEIAHDFRKSIQWRKSLTPEDLDREAKSNGFELIHFEYPDGDDYRYVKAHPMADRFLAELNKISNGQVYLCTSSHELYAKKIVEHFGFAKHLRGIFHRKDINERSVPATCENFILIDDLGPTTAGIARKMQFLGKHLEQEYYSDPDEHEKAVTELFGPHFTQVERFDGKDSDSLQNALNQIRKKI